MRRNGWLVISFVLFAIALSLVLTACGSFGEAHNHNAPPMPTNTDIQLNWRRIDTPGNYHTVIHACFGKDGLYLTQADNNSITVVPEDPNCQ